jgi:hypothetical protein
MVSPGFLTWIEAVLSPGQQLGGGTLKFNAIFLHLWWETACVEFLGC